jgi:hypothetical protein
MKQKNNFRFHFWVFLTTLLMLFVYNTHAAKAAEMDATGAQKGNQEPARRDPLMERQSRYTMSHPP